MKNFSYRFICGLKNHNLTDDEIESEGVEYCGGNKNEALEFFEDYHEANKIKNYNIFDDIDKCFCGKEKLVLNYYIRKKSTDKNFDPDDYITLGSKCIKRFTKHMDLTESYFIDDRSESDLTVNSNDSDDSSDDSDDTSDYCDEINKYTNSQDDSLFDTEPEY